MSARRLALRLLAAALAAAAFEARAADFNGSPVPPDGRSYSDRAPAPEEYYDADGEVDGERDERYSQRDEGADDFYYREDRLYQRYRDNRGRYDDRDYAHAPPPPPPPPYRADVPPPPHGSLKDQGYGEGAPPPPRFERRQAYGEGCLRPRAIERRLVGDGWGDFGPAGLAGTFVRIEARRPSGALYDLTLDRCTGDIVAARMRHGPVLGRYARGPRFYRY